MKVLWDKLKKLLKWILPIGGVLTFLIQFASGWYEGHADKLIIQCSIENNKVGFSTDGEYRAVILKLHPQMIIRYEDTVILIVYLDGYYEEEFLQFQKDGTCSTIKCHEEYVNKLISYLYGEISDKIGKDRARQGLKIYVSTVGGVKYMNRDGNQEKRFCIFETDGMVWDVDISDEEIEERLFEKELVLTDNLLDMEKSDEFINMAEVAAEEILKMH